MLAEPSLPLGCTVSYACDLGSVWVAVEAAVSWRGHGSADSFPLSYYTRLSTQQHSHTYTHSHTRLFVGVHWSMWRVCRRWAPAILPRVAACRIKQ